MNNDNVTNGFESYENDWLEVKYVSPQHMQEEQAKKQNVFAKAKDKLKSKFTKNKQDEQEVVPCRPKAKRTFAKGFKKVLKPVGVCALIALLVAGMIFVDNGFVGDVFGYAKDTFTSNADTSGEKTKQTMSLPANATVAVQDGNVTLTGGTIAVNFLSGRVTDVTDTSVTVSCDDGFGVIYSNLSQVLVAKDDVVSQYHVLGKYDDNAVVSLLQDGQKITGVSADGYTLSW